MPPSYQIFRGGTRFGITTYFIAITVTDAPWGHEPGIRYYSAGYHVKNKTIGAFKSFDQLGTDSAAISDAPEKIAAYAVHLASAWVKKS